MARRHTTSWRTGTSRSRQQRFSWHGNPFDDAHRQRRIRERTRAQRPHLISAAEHAGEDALGVGARPTRSHDAPPYVRLDGPPPAWTIGEHADTLDRTALV